MRRLHSLLNRSPHELLYRGRQEAMNRLLSWFPPKARDLEAGSPLSALPDTGPVVDRLRSTPFAGELEAIARRILRHRFPLLGLTIETGPEIDWRRDYLSGRTSPAVFFKRLPYLDHSVVGDHKIIWEMNRHQHLVVLAQAWRLTGEREYLQEMEAQLTSWLDANPFQRGINWASALEVAFRALSWIWIWHLAGNDFAAALRSRFLESLYRHGLHLEWNLSIYFSPNTHLLGEAVALYALGKVFPRWPKTAQWRRTGAQLVRQQMERQVQPDGSHFEQSTYYHVYALDFFLFYRVLGGPADPDYDGKLAKMAEFLAALLGPSGRLFFAGDDDGGRLFHPYGDAEIYGRATLAACGVWFERGEWIRNDADLPPIAAWWLGVRVFQVELPAPQNPQGKPQSSRLFPDAGLAVMVAESTQVLVDVGLMGSGGAGHSHADALQVLLRHGDAAILTDSGTYTYVGDGDLRDWFRGTAAHNTVRIGEQDQAVAVMPFRWEDKPEVEVVAWETGPAEDRLIGRCRYRGFVHERQIRFDKTNSLLSLEDLITGPAGDHLLELFWHCSEAEQMGEREVRLAEGIRLLLEGEGAMSLESGRSHGWRSPVFGVREPRPVIRFSRQGALPVRWRTTITIPPGASGSGSLLFKK